MTESATFADRLEDAIERARGWDFDLPSQAARERASTLLHCLARNAVDPAGIGISVAVDGAIAIASSNGRHTVTVEIEPVSARLHLVVTDEVKKAIVADVAEPTEAEILRKLGRAA